MTTKRTFWIGLLIAFAAGLAAYLAQKPVAGGWLVPWWWPFTQGVLAFGWMLTLAVAWIATREAMDRDDDERGYNRPTKWGSKP